jgi:AmmeMemoRadiSam system protein B
MTMRSARGTVSGAVRPPAVAGSFYPASERALATMVASLFESARRLLGVQASRPMPMGLLVPHAGLVYSGVTAAAGWSQLAGEEPAPSVVLLGTNHGAGWLDGIGAWEAGAWMIPTGEVEVDAELATAILALGRPFTVDHEAHAFEHSIEVQLPLLHAACPRARIVPLAVSAGRWQAAIDAGRRLGELLARWRAAGHASVLAISTDMAHYPPDATCRRVTETLLEPILALDALELARRELEVLRQRSEGLVCGMCGIEPTVVGLAALRAMDAVHATSLVAATSADAGGSPAETVGYLAVRFDR